MGGRIIELAIVRRKLVCLNKLNWAFQQSQFNYIAV
jgi:hypothetical protein